jgi:hypothetical protein
MTKPQSDHERTLTFVGVIATEGPGRDSVFRQAFLMASRRSCDGDTKGSASVGVGGCTSLRPCRGSEPPGMVVPGVGATE